MSQQQFAENASSILSNDPFVTGLAVAGSWLTNEIDEYSDLDLILVTKEKITHDKALMTAYADRLGNLLSAFTGEHVGEPRLLICLYDDPLLHVDIKFVTLEEFGIRIETPHLLLDKEAQLANALKSSEAKYPWPGYQWIEDRFWTWMHYAAVKIGRGEYLEAFDFFSDIRRMVLAPLLHIRNGNLPKTVRKVEMQLPKHDLERLLMTIPSYNRTDLLKTLDHTIGLYCDLRSELFTADINLRSGTEQKVTAYLRQLNK